MTVRLPLSAEDVARVYKKHARYYDKTFARVIRQPLRTVVREVNNEISGHLLDVGIGTGMSLPLYKPDLQITGIDISAEMLHRARRRIGKHRLKNVAALLEMDRSAMTFPDNHFDAVLATFVLSVAPDPAQMLAEMQRVCKPGGRIYVFNHFHAEGDRPILKTLERRLAFASRNLGWHPDIQKNALKIEQHGLRPLSERRLGMLGLFTFIKLEKPATNC